MPARQDDPKLGGGRLELRHEIYKVVSGEFILATPLQILEEEKYMLEN